MYTNQLGEADFERLLGAHPSEVYQKLTQSATPREKIFYAVTTRQQSLHPEDFTDLEAANGNPRTFGRALQKIVQRTSASESPDKLEYLETLKQLENEAIHDVNPINYPYIEELYSQGFIDATTRAKLYPPQGTTNQQFLEALGTQKDFLADLRKSLLTRITTQIDVTEDGQKDWKTS
ncbi:hypothetical protein PtA15_5A813 [Puccinia triticina]|uniref:Uncharacterized protein n=1 Tax=Puccinia triticina TaxID=208348 RepID=A0ABY7CKP8_9BASI|nr:uncharacterized protein PtA15_5A813 [Puccinia triticina]WAQ85239.1 hypothetical protein PtA15_5A813 [Puccinia triticina]